jgi:antitoxin component YwqK of YwqJK toxin-antitoxin module
VSSIKKLFYLKICLVLAVLALVTGLFFEISIGSPQKSKWIYIFQKFYLKKELNWPKNFSGVWKEWNENGELMVSTQVKDGVMNGEQMVWAKWEFAPKYLYKSQFYKNGKLHGRQEYFMPNGGIFSITNWETGEKNGQEITFYDVPKIRNKSEYKNNILDGAYVGYFKDGTKKMEGNFKNDKRIGEWYYVEPNGKIHNKLNVDDKAELPAILLLDWDLSHNE